MGRRYVNPETGHFKCGKCLKELPQTEFYFRKVGKPTKASICKNCCSARIKLYNARPEIKQKNSARAKERSKLRWIDSEYRLLTNARLFLREHGITHEERDLLFAQQEFKCALCGQTKPLHIDHDHSHTHKGEKIRPSTGKMRHYSCKLCIRGGLCSDCNFRLLPVLEPLSHLHTEQVQTYLENRPFVETPSKISIAA